MTQPSAASTSQADPPPYAPLAGTKVIEWSSYASGPFAGKVLAALGADVIKIEAPLVGDESRRAGPFPGDLPDSEQSALFLYLNNGKRSITLDPSTADGHALLLRLITEWADLFLEDRPPALMAQLGLQYEALSAIKPELIMVSITPFGQNGAYRDFKLYPSQLSFAGGASYPLPDGFNYAGLGMPPTPWPGFVSDYASATMAAGATIAAIFARLRNGRGQHLDISKQQTQMHPVRQTIDRHAREPGVTHTRSGTSTARIAGTYQCKDGWVSLWPGREPNMPQAIADFLGHPAWTGDPLWHSEEHRNAHAAKYQALLQQELMRFTMDEVYHTLQAANMVVAQVYAAEHILQDSQLKFRKFIRPVRDDHVGELPYPVLPFKISTAADRAPGWAPRLGEHNADIYCELLGLPRTELAALRTLGAV